MARIVTFPTAKPDGPVPAGTISHDLWGADMDAVEVVPDPVVATEKMWWRASGRLAYPEGATFSAVELPLLVPDVEHEANMRAGISDAEAVVVEHHPSAGPVFPTEPLVPVETRLIAHAPEVRDDAEERRGPGRPKLLRDKDGTIIR